MKKRNQSLTTTLITSENKSFSLTISTTTRLITKQNSDFEEDTNGTKVEMLTITKTTSTPTTSLNRMGTEENKLQSLTTTPIKSENESFSPTISMTTTPITNENLYMAQHTSADGV